MALFKKIEEFSRHQAGRVHLLECPSLAHDILWCVGTLDALVSWTRPPFLDLLNLLVKYGLLRVRLLRLFE